MTSVLLLDVVGLTPRALSHMPRLRAVAASGAQTRLGTVLPAVTCSVQSTLLTGLAPAQHGIVGNGWYFRDLGEVHLWRQHNRLVQGEKVWETARRARPEFTAANIGWWYAMGATTDITVTPRPIYHADGRKSPDAYVRPPALHDELVGALGEFPLFQYWGPTASIRLIAFNLCKVHAVHKAFGRVEATPLASHLLIYDSVVFNGGFPAHSSDKSNRLHR